MVEGLELITEGKGWRVGGVVDVVCELCRCESYIYMNIHSIVLYYIHHHSPPCLPRLICIR